MRHKVQIRRNTYSQIFNNFWRDDFLIVQGKILITASELEDQAFILGQGHFVNIDPVSQSCKIFWDVFGWLLNC